MVTRVERVERVIMVERMERIEKMEKIANQVIHSFYFLPLFSQFRSRLTIRRSRKGTVGRCPINKGQPTEHTSLLQLCSIAKTYWALNERGRFYAARQAIDPLMATTWLHFAQRLQNMDWYAFTFDLRSKYIGFNSSDSIVHPRSVVTLNRWHLSLPYRSVPTLERSSGREGKHGHGGGEGVCRGGPMPSSLSPVPYPNNTHPSPSTQHRITHHPVHSIASLPDSYHHTPVIQHIVSLLLVSSYTSNPVIQYINHPDKNAYITNMTSICSLDFTRLLYIHSINQYSTYYLPLSFAYFTSTHRSFR